MTILIIKQIRAALKKEKAITIYYPRLTGRELDRFRKQFSVRREKHRLGFNGFITFKRKRRTTNAKKR